MKPVLNFIKSNPILIASVLLFIGATVWLVLILGQGGKFKKELSSRGGLTGQLEQYKSVAVTLPPVTPDGAAETKTVAINVKGIQALDEVYKQMQKEYAAIFKVAADYNRGTYTPIEDGLFPTPTNNAKVFYAKKIYRDTFRRLLLPFSPDVKQEPRLHAGMPPSAKELDARLTQARADFVGGFATAKGEADLAEQDRERLRKLLQETLIGALKERATSLHIYADTDPASKEFPFVIDGWSDPKLDTRPSIEAVWESQMKLWYIQSLSWLLMDLNRVHDPQANILNRPIKRLYAMDVVPGYVGVNSKGGLNAKTRAQLLEAKDNGVLDPKKPASMGSPDARLPDDFGISPTGRRSNPIYDVRHARLHVVVDWERYPELLHKLNDSNFFTVISAQITDVDEYAHLREGFLYGRGDMIEVEMVIESIWLRDWTTQLMPDGVKTALAVPKS